jgi:CRP-like cAMP-binding protein
MQEEMSRSRAPTCCAAAAKAVLFRFDPNTMDTFWGNIFRRRSGPDDPLAVLSRIPIFAALSRRQLQAVERILHRRTYAQGEVVFRQGDPGVGMYIVARGRVLVSQDPGAVELAELGEGDFFGEIALLNETPRSATATALQNTTLFGFFQPDLISILERQPRIGVTVLRGLAEIAGERLVRTEVQLRDCQRAMANQFRQTEGEQG